MKKIKRTLWVFYALSAYVILQFVWWASYLIRLQKEQWELIHGESPSMSNDFSQRVWMIVGEGGVFLLLLAWGIWKVHSNLRNEAARMQRERNFLMSVTHEFKTPIASVGLILETLNRSGLKEEHKSKLFTQGMSELNRLNELSENILLSARLEHEEDLFASNPMNLSSLYHEELERISQLPKTGHRVEFNVEEEIVVEGDSAALLSVLNNLIENALKYSSAEDKVQVELKRKGNRALLFVSDNGPGLNEKDKIKVFEKFYRVGKEETRIAKGTGLGLYIVAEICRSHKGRIKITDNQPKGSTFEVSLPIISS